MDKEAEVKQQGIALEELGKILRATLMDDYYMRRFFKENIPCVQYVLRVIMSDPDLIVTEVTTQSHLKGPKHEVFLDVHAIGSDKAEYDIEIHRKDDDDLPERAFYNLAMLKTNMLEKKQPYSTLKRAVVIFITATDVIGDGLPLYTANVRVDETGKLLGVKAQILFVNNEIQDSSTELGRLMHDFASASADSMYSPLLADCTRNFKETEEGRNIMITVWQEAQEENIHQERREIARIMLEDGESEEKTARHSRLPLEEVQEIVREMEMAKAG